MANVKPVRFVRSGSNVVALSELQSGDTIAVADVNGAQATLVSGTNIKTINGNSVLGSGNLSIAASSPFSVPAIAASFGAF